MRRMNVGGWISAILIIREALRDALDKEGAELAIVAPKIGGVDLKSGQHLAADMALSGARLRSSLMPSQSSHRRRGSSADRP